MAFLLCRVGYVYFAKKLGSMELRQLIWADGTELDFYSKCR